MAEVSFTGYGKNDIRLMRVRREGEKYSVTELKVNVELQLETTKDYHEGDNSDVVATDSQKNTVLALAQQNTIKSPEQFASLLCKHFLLTYQQVVRVKVYAEQAPWQRIKQGGIEHYHAFIQEPSVVRFCTAAQLRGGEVKVCAGLKDMSIFKATQSGFTGFVRDRFTSLPYVNDRAFCTKVFLQYHFGSGDDGAEVDYNGIWQMARSAVLDIFAGPPYKGTFSPSVQRTMYDMAQLIFNIIPEIASMDITMPNIHYFTADLTKINIPVTGELLLPSDTPHGNISATFTRKTKSKL